MSRISVYVDGFNVYHALDYIEPTEKYPDIDPFKYRKYKWLDLSKLANHYVQGKAEKIENIYYFTTLSWIDEKRTRHQYYLNILESRGIKLVHGKFKKKGLRCKATCKERFRTREEKETDVNIALSLLRDAYENCYDKAIIISGDTDLNPAIRMVHEIFPNKEIHVVIPVGRKSGKIAAVAKAHYSMKEEHLKASLLSDPYEMPNGKIIACPESWK